jgi:hypothetical protein
MKKLLAIVFSAVALFALVGAVDSFAAPFPTGVGGLGTSQTPASGSIPIGNGAGSYTPAIPTAGPGVNITPASGSLSIANSGVQSVQSSSQVIASAPTGTNIQFTLVQNYLTAALLALNGMSAPNASVIAGTGLSYSTSTSGSNSTTTLTLNINNGSTQTCSANQFVNQITATGVTSCGSISFPAATATTTIQVSTTTLSGPSFILATSTAANTWNIVASGTQTFKWTIPPANDQYFAPSTTIPTNTNQLTNGAGFITGNQTITITASGDATGTNSGTTSITHNITVTGIQGKPFPVASTGTPYFKNGAWAIGNAVDASGNPFSTSTSANQAIREIAVTFDGAGAPIINGYKYCSPFTYAFTIKSVVLWTSDTATSTGTSTIDWLTATNAVYASSGPSAATSITSSTGNTLSAGVFSVVDSSLGSFTTTTISGTASSPAWLCANLTLGSSTEPTTIGAKLSVTAN